MKHADIAIIIANPEISSVRDSDRIIGLLDSKTERAKSGKEVEKHLLITRFDCTRAGTGEMLEIDDVSEILSIPLLGVVPESKDVLSASNLGIPVTLSDANCAPARAYINAAKRLCGEDIPVLLPMEKRRLFGGWFGGRAA